MTQAFQWERFHEFPVIGILRGFTSDASEEIVTTAIEAGLKNVEITLNTEGALEQIKRASEKHGDDVNIGAGTVLTIEDATAAVKHGASFIVTPVVDIDVIALCKDNDIPIFPGALTPTEIYQAWQLGADMVKLFPANRFGPSYLKDLAGPLSQIPLLPTGGITLETLSEYINNGAAGFGVGSPLFNKERMAAKDWDWLKEQIGKFYEVCTGSD